MSARRVTFTDEQASEFHDYFNAADEIYDSIVARMDQSQAGGGSMTEEWHLTLADLDVRVVKRARKAADRLALSWPPYLPEAEEFALSHAAGLDLYR